MSGKVKPCKSTGFEPEQGSCVQTDSELRLNGSRRIITTRTNNIVVIAISVIATSSNYCAAKFPRNWKNLRLKGDPELVSALGPPGRSVWGSTRLQSAPPIRVKVRLLSDLPIKSSVMKKKKAAQQWVMFYCLTLNSLVLHLNNKTLKPDRD